MSEENNSIDDFINEAKDKLCQIEEIKKLVEINASAVSAVKQKVEAENENISGKIKIISDYEPLFVILRDKLNDKDGGMEITLEKATARLKEIEEIVVNVNSIKDEVSLNNSKTNELYNDSIITKRLMENERVESLAIKAEIGKILNLVRDTGLANSFDRRRKRLESSSKVWAICFGSTVIITIAILLFVFIDPLKLFEMNHIENSVVRFFFKFSFTSPLIFLSVFSSIQYSKERFLLEQYEFKTASAIALDNYSHLLERRFPGDTYVEKRFELLNDFIRLVYKEPEYPKHKSNIGGRAKIPNLESDVEMNLKTDESH